MLAVKLADAKMQFTSDFFNAETIYVATDEDAVGTPFSVIARYQGARVELLNSVDKKASQGSWNVLGGAAITGDKLSQGMALEVCLIVEMHKGIAHQANE